MSSLEKASVEANDVRSLKRTVLLAVVSHLHNTLLFIPSHVAQ